MDAKKTNGWMPIRHFKTGIKSTPNCHMGCHDVSLSLSLFFDKNQGKCHNPPPKTKPPQESRIIPSRVIFFEISSRRKMWTAQIVLSDLQVILASQYPRTQITASSTSAVGRVLCGTCWGRLVELVVRKRSPKTERVGAIQYELLYTFLNG